VRVINSYGVLGWLSVVCAFFAYQVVYVVSTSVLGKLLGVATETASVGFGPKILSWRSWGAEWRLCGIPTGGYTKWAPDDLAQATVPTRALLLLCGPLANLMLGRGLLTIAGTAGHYATLIETLGKMGLILGVFNLLPLPPQSGGLLVILLVEAARGKELTLRVKSTLLKVGFFATWIVFFYGLRWLART
jgi:membrane-associated protease RseP (regulator of RpoE activity)